MLIEFTVGNFRSIRDKMTLSMVADRADHRLEETNVFPVNDQYSLLRTAAIYGANASGKSNFLNALTMLPIMVAELHRDWNRGQTNIPSDFLRLEPFRLNTANRELPCFFEAIFLATDAEYRYGVEFAPQQPYHVVREWLHRKRRIPKSKEVTLFQREEQSIQIFAAFPQGKKIKRFTPPGRLFLDVAAEFNLEEAKTVANEIRALRIHSTHVQWRSRLDFQLEFINRSDRRREFLATLLNGADIGIKQFKIFKEKVIRDNGNSPSRVDETVMQTQHAVYSPEGNPVEIDNFRLDREASGGTRELLALTADMLMALEEGGVLIADEVETNLHPLLTRRMIEVFQTPESNPKNAQLIFATHDTNLLSRTLLRRDQIWFTEKDERGATTLYSLADFKQPISNGHKVRNDASYEQAYLTGRYGGVPFLRDIDRLFNGNALADNEELEGAGGSVLAHAQ